MTFPLTVSEFRTHVTTSLGDDAVQRLLDAAEEAIIERAGPTITDYPATDRTEMFTPHGDRLMLSERATDIVEVIERAHYASPTTLAADDYELSASGYILRRLRTGTTASIVWRPLVAVTYAPYSDIARREVAQIALAELEINTTPGATSERIGDWSETQSQGASDYEEQRAAILDTLHSDPVVMF